MHTDFNRSGRTNCCFGCTDRYVTEDSNCHSTCERYKKFKENVAKEKHNKIREEKLRLYDFDHRR